MMLVLVPDRTIFLLKIYTKFLFQVKWRWGDTLSLSDKRFSRDPYFGGTCEPTVFIITEKENVKIGQTHGTHSY